jgi:threonine aldolase
VTAAPIDLSSDVHAQPTEEMWEAMRRARLGWATHGQDPSVNELQQRMAALLGKEAALWVPTCGMANLVALLTFCEPGDRVVLESASHVLTSEAMGIVEIARLEPRSLWAEDGRMAPDEVEALVRESDAALLVLENTHTRAGGTTLSLELTEALAAAAARQGCRVHVDGARLPNAAAALGVPLAALAAPANSAALSMNKALGAPMGAVLAGS